MDHPCIVKLIEVLVPTKKLEPNNFNEIFLVLEFGESDLKKLLKSSLHLELIHIKTILWNLLHAIEYLHECKVLHRDLKPANILINEDCSIKVCDFGLARSVDGICDKSKKLLDDVIGPDEIIIEKPQVTQHK